jgi:hypothetical protein
MHAAMHAAGRMNAAAQSLLGRPGRQVKIGTQQSGQVAIRVQGWEVRAEM